MWYELSCFQSLVFSTEKLKPVDVSKMYGALDLGGGSVQITIPLNGKVPYTFFL